MVHIFRHYKNIKQCLVVFVSCKYSPCNKHRADSSELTQLHVDQLTVSHMYMIPTADVLLRQYCELLLELSRLECQ